MNPNNTSAIFIAVLNFHDVLNEECFSAHASLVVDQEQDLLLAGGHSDVSVLPMIFIAPGPACHIASVLKFDPDILYMTLVQAKDEVAKGSRWSPPFPLRLIV